VSQRVVSIAQRCLPQPLVRLLELGERVHRYRRDRVR
jgi:hypothetical protein